MQRIEFDVLLAPCLTVLLMIQPAWAESERYSITVPEGFDIRQAASFPLVERPMFAALDQSGHLYVLDSGGSNGGDRLKNPTDVIRRLTDTNGDGIYDQSTIFADKIVFGTGIACHDGAVFITSPPSLWRFEDTTGDGIADQRVELVTGFAFNQSCTDDLHGTTVGPDGRIYFLPGRFHHKVRLKDGTPLRDGVGPWLMRCRPDGSDVEFVSGAVGNPVEVAFLPNGDSFIQGTFWAKSSAPGGLRDGLIHAVAGGEYSVRDRDYSDRIRTGDYLPALVPLTATAPSGLTSYRSSSWGDEFQENLFSSHFNTGKILRHRLKAESATYRCETEEFITAPQGTVHFTDVLEDADGSLLIVDTGGWFIACCPASGSSQPTVKGSIFRILRNAATKVQDPYGNLIPWKSLPTDDLLARLDDSRVMVQERAIIEVARREQRMTDALATLLTSPQSSFRQRTGAVWALCRMDDNAARAATRLAFRDPSHSVRQAAAYSAGLHRDRSARQTLEALLVDESSGVRREAANALGRLQQKESIPALLKSLEPQQVSQRVTADRFLEHAITFALIQINHAESTRAGLLSHSADVQRITLIALDQMPLTILDAKDLTPLLSSGNTPLRQAAIQVLSRHPQWTAESIALIDEWFKSDQINEDRVQIIAGFVRTLQHEPQMQETISRNFQEQQLRSKTSRRALLIAVSKLEKANIPQGWLNGIEESLAAEDTEICMAALDAVGKLSLLPLERSIRRIAQEPAREPQLRLKALRTLTTLDKRLSDSEFEYLVSRLSAETPIRERITALDVIANTTHDEQRLSQLLPFVKVANPVELPYLLAAYVNCTNKEIIEQLVEALEVSSATPTLDMIEQILKPHGEEVQRDAAPLLERLRKLKNDQLIRLNEWEQRIEGHKGDSERGRLLFMNKAQCHLCHVTDSQDKVNSPAKIGPDLAAIGEIRTRRELLEAILFPSASFARGFEPIVVTLQDGRVWTGLAGKETTEEFILTTIQDNKPVEKMIRRNEIEEVAVGRVSAMPNGLEQPLTAQEFADLMTFLQNLRASKVTKTVTEGVAN
ncbi:heme-binding protein [Planctopirus limnophila DSM 3776]|uniref:Heme-binding protein n=1 Tax=Planctopirus limnophila (strain ATCC 43296 / DSM 3776 / IFAM 1008 / Mu 290) TaxID=521674 RepID=D5SVK0_PLAL2|nr:PVC-type heme-binding CxxCH protein [Planctopirus limnophila]ADG67270.1 heme-binding protein [Planctopirus limnophila DSM 3776]